MSDLEQPPARRENGLPATISDREEERRSRLTVFFRLLLAIPHLLWFGIWSSGMVLLSPVLWIATLIKGRPPEGLRDLYAMWIRYAVHVYAYTCLVGNAFPGFLGTKGSYPIDVDFPPAPEHQNRWGVGFRFFLALPPLMLAGTLSGGGGGSSAGFSAGLLVLIAFRAWFAALATGRMPRGLQAAAVYTLGYTSQAYAYLFLLTDRYPDSHPATSPVRPLPPHPVTLSMDDDPHRSRLTVFFRILLAFPHFVWLTLWAIAALFAGIANWVYALFAGRPAAPLHRFLTRFVRYSTHVGAFVLLAGGPFPGFAGAPGSYPIDIEVAPPERQNRWKTLFRGLLAFPALFVASGLSGAAYVGAVGAWFASLFTARMPLGLRGLMAWSLRYQAQTYAYLYVLTDRYPYAAPGPCDREPAAPAEDLPPAPEATLTPAPQPEAI